MSHPAGSAARPAITWAVEPLDSRASPVPGTCCGRSFPPTLMGACHWTPWGWEPCVSSTSRRWLVARPLSRAQSFRRVFMLPYPVSSKVSEDLDAYLASLRPSGRVRHEFRGGGTQKIR